MILAVKTAQGWGKPPSFMITGGGEWSDRDRVLALGYQLYTQMLCPECGNPVSICRDPNRDGWFEAKTETCYAVKAVATHTGQQGYKPEPGEIIYPHLEEPVGGGYATRVT